MSTRRWMVSVGAVITWTLGFAGVAVAQGSAPPPPPPPVSGRPLTLEERLEQLDQQVRILKRLAELARDSAAAAAKEQPRLGAGREGFVLKSADGDFQLRLRGYIQADGRVFPDVAAALGTSSLFLRRVRPVTDVTAWRYFGLRLTPDFGGGRVVLYDAYLDLRLRPELALRAGKTKPPIGLERLQSATDLRFVERGLPTDLVPNRDVGVQISGDLFGGALSYAAGVFNGVPDLGNGDGDASNDKDLVGRLFSNLRGLGLGLAASTGNEHGTVSASGLPSYVSPGQQTLFRYRDSTVANGRRYRVAPQAYYYAGPLGLLGEYVVSAQNLTRGAASGRVRNTGWQVAGSWFLTGEQASYTVVTPRRPFDPAAGAWGAVELAVRYGELTLDDAAFPVYANAATSVRKARAWAVGVTWHLARAEQIEVNYEDTRFTGGAGTRNRAPEHFLVTRIQQAF